MENPPRRRPYFLLYQSAFTGVKLDHFSGRSSSANIAVTGQTGTHAPQSMHSTGLMNSCFSPSNPASSLRGWMQSTGQTSTHAVSFVPMHGSAITYAIQTLLLSDCGPAAPAAERLNR